jgi:hypothetical protein
MLAAIGEAPVTTVEGSVPRDVSMALTELRDSLRRLNAKPWRFNTYHSYKLPPFATVGGKRVFRPQPEWLNAKPARVPEMMALDVVLIPEATVNAETGPVFYDRVSETYLLDAAVLVMDVIVHRDFAALPEVARQYVVSRATRIFTARMANDLRAAQVESLDELDALKTLKQQYSPDKKYNLFSDASLTHMIGLRRRS